jgi:hypothetical protein
MARTNQPECYFCGVRVADIGQAIAAGWVPSFYEPGDEIETAEPVCPACCEKHLEEDENGDLVRATD